MNIKITSRHFKANDTLKARAITSVENLEKYFDGIIKAEVIFSFDKTRDSDKTAEIVLKLHAHVLRSAETSDDFVKSLEIALKKMEKQLLHAKSKFREKNKKILRKVKLQE